MIPVNEVRTIEMQESKVYEKLSDFTLLQGGASKVNCQVPFWMGWSFKSREKYHMVLPAFNQVFSLYEPDYLGSFRNLITSAVACGAQKKVLGFFRDGVIISFNQHTISYRMQPRSSRRVIRAHNPVLVSSFQCMLEILTN